MPVRPLGRPARHLDAVGSTMTEAAAWAAGGAPHGALVVAGHQRAGRGRWGRAWADEPGQSLMLSVVLRPALGAGSVGLVSLAAGLALAEALDAFGVAGVGQVAERRPPGRAEAGRRARGGVVGGAAGPSWSWASGSTSSRGRSHPGLAETATSVRLVTGRPVERLAPLAPFLGGLARRLADAEGRPARLVADVEGRMEELGEDVAVGFPGTDRPAVRGPRRRARRRRRAPAPDPRGRGGRPRRRGHARRPVVILVTGATGFVGSRLVRDLVAGGGGRPRPPPADVAAGPPGQGGPGGSSTPSAT